MYFNAETQSQIVSRFHFALRDEGYLFLGKAEMLLTYNTLFTPANVKQRIFRKIPRMNFRDRVLRIAQSGQDDPASTDHNLLKLRESIIESSPQAQIAVDINNTLILANAEARRLFGITDQDISLPFQDLEISYRPVELRSAIEQIHTERIPILIKSIL
jgi:two-component system CheB/CheR fusion protein